MDLTEIKNLIEECKLNPSRRRGQNFLFDRNILSKIISSSNVLNNDRVLEVGAGFGNLTQYIARCCEFVLAVEMDKKIAPLLEREIAGYGNVELLIKDVMKIDISEIALSRRLNRMVSNLPYSIAAPLILKILTDCPGVAKMHCAVQKEVAQRMTAKPGNKNYSGHTVKLNFLSDVRILFDISRNSFFPSPNIDSSFVEVNRKEPSDENLNTSDFFDFIDACFASRRKTIANSLMISPKFNVTKSKIEEALITLGFTSNTRAEQLSSEFLLLLFKIIA